MPYRIDIIRDGIAAILSFQGVLDADALADLRSRVGARATPPKLLLRAGTEVDPGCIDGLRRLPVAELHAESPFLARWISEEPS